jgi:hypothetical protein
MLDKFQDQDLMHSVEQVENLRDKIIDVYSYDRDIVISFNKIIDTVKNIHPSLFNNPKSAKYITGKFDPTIVEKDNADT